ncbi:uncharacterized protein Z518_02811 [Rhinocladiella mackenziei CBS 650.93]|uniref:Uncharacterized protein n=1 Tax=Rhinocladiella mackenziei CBS 650.93 TaxID=1442369 RepID=A0A0D2JFS1_9EURO|nr:uncharacterized protein Z518_02811 [Rhinocladiella mackenziei CBS 650.93]KIX08155.1 hypothetical protein Z518_02811 [Rhinocladiella mackenziei CBS 650.93]
MSFLNNDDRSEPTCDMPSSFVADASEPFIGDLSFHQFNMAVSGGCAAFATVSIFILMARHATHFSKPNEQSKILKICAIIPLEAIFSWIGIAAPNSHIYVEGFVDFFQAIGLSSFFLLLCEFVSPSSEFRDVFFAALEIPKSRRKKDGKKVDGLSWYRKRWVAVFQYPFVSLVIAVVTCITQAIGRYCLESSNVHFAHIWCTIIINISIFVAVISCVKFYTIMKKDLEHHKPLAKFLAFKLIIFLTFVQRIIFEILRSANALKETSKLTYADVNWGIETMLVCIEMVPFSLFFHYAYDVGAYNLSRARPLPLSEMGGRISPNEAEAQAGHEQQERERLRYGLPGQYEGQYYGGRLGLKAWATLPNLKDILLAMNFAFTMRSERRRMKRDPTVTETAPPMYINY